jgi:hypothetical protein
MPRAKEEVLRWLWLACPNAARWARLWNAAESRGVPLRAILATVAEVGAVCLAGNLAYRLRDVLLLILIAGFVALLLNPLVASRSAGGAAPGHRSQRGHGQHSPAARSCRCPAHRAPPAPGPARPDIGEQPIHYPLCWLRPRRVTSASVSAAASPS